MRVAGGVEIHHLALDGVLREREVEDNLLASGRVYLGRLFPLPGRPGQTRPLAGLLVLRRERRLHANLQRRQRPPGVAVAGLDQERQRVVGQRHRNIAEAAFLVRERSRDERADVVARQRLEGEDLASRQERRIDREERVLRRRPDQDDDAFLHIGQEHVLLGPVEAVDLVEEEDGPLAELFEVLAGLGEDFADLLDPGRDRVHRLEAALGVVGDDVRERRLARPRRAVEDQRREPVGQEHPAEKFAFAQEVLLPNELVERSRPHPRRQRPGLVAILFAKVVEEVHGPLRPENKLVQNATKRHRPLLDDTRFVMLGATFVSAAVTSSR